MKEKSASQSAPARRSLGEGGFFNLRVLVGLFIVLAGIFLALLGLGAVSNAFAQGKDTKNNSSAASQAPTGTQKPDGGQCSWSSGSNLPMVGVRFVGVYFSANGKFYAMGGRNSDSAGSEFMHPFEYDPGTNTWTEKSATYPDNFVNNMACGVLTDAGTPYIYCVGGSFATGTTATDRVFRYNPVTDALTTVAAPWPGAMGTNLPGGFSVFNNKLYILGGFNINVAMVDTIYEFTPSPAGWVLKNAHLPVPLGYIPTTTIGNFIYTAGGSAFDPVVILIDTNNAFKYDPVADSITTIANIPRATAETRALTFCNQMYVMGGGRTSPNPSNEVDIYDPGSDTWSTGLPFVTPRRNFATDTNGSDHIWLAGGYASDQVTLLDTMEIFSCPVSPCGSPTPTPTPGQIRLRAGAHIADGTKVVRLHWTGATTDTVDIYRNDALRATVNNDGEHTDVLTVRGIYTYKVCEAGTTNCSNEVEVRFRGP